MHTGQYSIQNLLRYMKEGYRHRTGKTICHHCIKTTKPRLGVLYQQGRSPQDLQKPTVRLKSLLQKTRKQLLLQANGPKLPLENKFRFQSPSFHMLAREFLIGYSQSNLKLTQVLSLYSPQTNTGMKYPAGSGRVQARTNIHISEPTTDTQIVKSLVVI